jgi:hypothetical protein
VRAAAAATAAASGNNKLAILLRLEAEIRQLPNGRAIAYHAVNEWRALLGFAQGFYLRANNRGSFSIEAVSDVARPDTNGPLLSNLAKAVTRHCTTHAKPLAIDLSRLLPAHAFAHPFGLWLPLLRKDGTSFAGLLLARQSAWEADSIKIAERIAGTCAHALQAITPPSLLRRVSLPRWALWAIPLIAAALLLVPVPLTTLAPFEVVPRDPMPVTSPLDGVISDIFVSPNEAVRRGQSLYQLETTELAASEAIAAQKVTVAEARLETSRNGAFVDTDLLRSMAVAEKELSLAKAEHEFAAQQLHRSLVRAEADGVLVYSAKADWLGRPIRVGEKVMDIADPARIAYRIEVSIQDSIALGDDAHVRLFFDADPLNPRMAVVGEESYHALPVNGGTMAYIVKALPPSGEKPPRLGLRGTAQLSGHTVNLGFYLFRRPIAALRQQFGI